MSLMMDDVNIIIFPMKYAKKEWPDLWKDRTDLESTRGHTTDHIGFGVDSLEQTLERLRKDGVQVTDESRSVADGKVRFAFIEGPDHIRIELVGQARKE
jgi:catechol 2,3-dioxygenase-like lactoylglutathione lyase family enzyme